MRVDTRALLVHRRVYYVITSLSLTCKLIQTLKNPFWNMFYQYSNLSVMESRNSQPDEGPSALGVGEHLPSTPFSCRPCRSRKLKCDRVQPCCGRCTGLGDTCEYPKERRANVGRRKRVIELETKVGQLIPPLFTLSKYHLTSVMSQLV